MSGLFASQTQGQKTAKKYIGQGVGELQQGQQDFLQSPLWLLGSALGLSQLQQPFTYTPEVVNNMKATATGQAQNAYQGALGQSLERAGATGTYRGGAQRNNERNLAQGLGDTVGNINRTIDTQAAMQRNPDISAALQTMQQLLAQQFGWNKDIANLYAGASTNPIWGQPSPGSQTLGGLGSLLGGIFGGGAGPGGFLGLGSGPQQFHPPGWTTG